MNAAPPEPVQSLPTRFTLIIVALCDALAARCSKNSAIAPTGLLIWRRLKRAAARFQALFERWREGRLPTPRPRLRSVRTQRQPSARMPGGFAWLVRLVPEAAAYGSQLQYLLAEPDMAAFLAEVPQAGRMLRPLCRMLAAQPPPGLCRSKNPDPERPAITVPPPEVRPPTSPPPVLQPDDPAGFFVLGDPKSTIATA